MSDRPVIYVLRNPFEHSRKIRRRLEALKSLKDDASMLFDDLVRLEEVLFEMCLNDYLSELNGGDPRTPVEFTDELIEYLVSAQVSVGGHIADIVIEVIEDSIAEILKLLNAILDRVNFEPSPRQLEIQDGNIYAILLEPVIHYTKNDILIKLETVHVDTGLPDPKTVNHPEFEEMVNSRPYLESIIDDTTHVNESQIDFNDIMPHTGVTDRLDQYDELIADFMEHYEDRESIYYSGGLSSIHRGGVIGCSCGLHPIDCSASLLLHVIASITSVTDPS